MKLELAFTTACVLIGAVYTEQKEWLSQKRLENKLTRMFDDGAYLNLGRMFEVNEVYERAKDGKLDCRFIVTAMQVTDGALRRRYIRLFRRSFWKARHEKKPIKELLREMVKNEIYTRMQRQATVWATAGKLLSASGLQDSSEIVIPNICKFFHGTGRWTEVLRLVLKNWGIAQGVKEGAYDEELMELLKVPELADVFYSHCLDIGCFSQLIPVVGRNAEFGRLLIGDESVAGKFHCGIAEFFDWVVENWADPESVDQLVRGFVADGYWLCLGYWTLRKVGVVISGRDDAFAKLWERHLRAGALSARVGCQ